MKTEFAYCWPLFRIKKYKYNTSDKWQRHSEDTGTTTRPIPVWVLTTDNSQHTTEKLKNITRIPHVKITIETLRKKKTIVQCPRCQGFGHKAPFCHLPRKCRLCAQGHDTRECPNRHLPLKCAGCGGGYQASSTECPKVIKHKQQTRQRPKVNLTEQSDFPALPVISPTPPQNLRYNRHPTPSIIANDTSLATLISLHSSPQLSKFSNPSLHSYRNLHPTQIP